MIKFYLSKYKKSSTNDNQTWGRNEFMLIIGILKVFLLVHYIMLDLVVLGSHERFG